MRLLFSKRGISMMEVLVAVVLIGVGIIGLLSLLPSGWRLSGTSDALGRAAGILQAELEANEVWIMNGNNTVTATATPDVKVICGAGRVLAEKQPGDIEYTVATERADLGGRWRVRVRVTWPGNAVGISESLIVTQQKYFFQ